jgi:UDP:flavonoid glycosyltransferase YjiC (YdhE family)
MAAITFLPLPEMSHLIPTLKLAKGLRSRGHRVSYLGIADFAATVRLEQLEFIPVCEDLYPVGFLQRQAVKKGRVSIAAISDEALRRNHAANVVQELLQIICVVKPDLFIIDNLLADVALLIKEMSIPIVLLNTQLFNLWEEQPAYEALLSVSELVMSPPVFDFPREQRRKKPYHIEASIDMKRREPWFDWEQLNANKPLIYCALGTMSHITGRDKLFLQTVIDAMQYDNTWQLVMSIGAHLSTDDFHGIPPNVVLVNRAPQLAMLKRASIMITHGGFNSVKECIMFGVPMLLFPTLGDTAQIAARVVYHGLGARANICNVSAQDIYQMIGRIDQSPSVRKRMASMREAFKEMEESGIGVALIESFLSAS